jgi:hypothetical protein
VAENVAGGANKRIINVDGNTYDSSTYNTPIAAGGNTVLFTNTKDATADTGINLDITPYLAVFILAAAGVIFLCTRKRENRF